MKKKTESVLTITKVKKKGVAKKHPNKKESNKPYKAQGR
jgi:hypothetical protein